MIIQINKSTIEQIIEKYAEGHMINRQIKNLRKYKKSTN